MFSRSTRNFFNLFLSVFIRFYLFHLSILQKLCEQTSFLILRNYAFVCRQHLHMNDIHVLTWVLVYFFIWVSLKNFHFRQAVRKLRVVEISEGKLFAVFLVWQYSFWSNYKCKLYNPCVVASGRPIKILSNWVVEISEGKLFAISFDSILPNSFNSLF